MVDLFLATEGDQSWRFDELGLPCSRMLLQERFLDYCSMEGYTRQVSRQDDVPAALRTALIRGLDRVIPELNVSVPTVARKGERGFVALVTLLKSELDSYLLPLAGVFPNDSAGHADPFNSRASGLERFRNPVGVVIEVDENGEDRQRVLLVENTFRESVVHACQAEAETGENGKVAGESADQENMAGGVITSLKTASILVHEAYMVSLNLSEHEIPMGVRRFRVVSEDPFQISMTVWIAGQDASDRPDNGALVLPYDYEKDFSVCFGQDDFGFLVHGSPEVSLDLV